MFAGLRASANDPSASALFNHLFRSILVTQEHAFSIDVEAPIPVLKRCCGVKSVTLPRDRQVQSLTLHEWLSDTYTCISNHLFIDVNREGKRGSIVYTPRLIHQDLWLRRQSCPSLVFPWKRRQYTQQPRAPYSWSLSWWPLAHGSDRYRSRRYYSRLEPGGGQLPGRYLFQLLLLMQQHQEPSAYSKGVLAKLLWGFLSEDKTKMLMRWDTSTFFFPCPGRFPWFHISSYQWNYLSCSFLGDRLTRQLVYSL